MTSDLNRFDRAVELTALGSLRITRYAAALPANDGGSEALERACAIIDDILTRPRMPRHYVEGHVSKLRRIRHRDPVCPCRVKFTGLASKSLATVGGVNKRHSSTGRRRKFSAAGQHRRFVEMARKLGADESEECFDIILRCIASAPPPKTGQKRKCNAKRQKS